MKKLDKTIVPRNPFVMLAKQRVAGAHNKLNKITIINN